MSLLALEGWEGASATLGRLSGSSNLYGTITRGSWSQASLFCGSSQGITYAWQGSASEFYFGVGWRTDNTLTSQLIMAFLSPNNTEQVSVRLTSGGQLTWTRGGTVLGTGSTVLTAGRWYHLQGYVLVHDSTGRVQLKLDGLDEIHSGGSYIGSLDTRQDGATANVDRNTFERLNASSWWDDFVVHSTAGTEQNSWTGDRGVIRCRPVAVGFASDWLAQEEGSDTYDTEVLTNGVAAYVSLRLDETSGTTADNAEGTAARDGTYENSPTLGTASGRDRIRSGDKYVVLDGSDDRIALSTDTLQLVTAGSAWSAEIWARFHAGTGNVLSGIWAGRSSTDGDPVNCLYLWQQSDGIGLRLRWDTRGDNGAGLNQLAVALGSDYAVDGVHDVRGCGHWHHIVCTRSTAGVKRIYYDGRQIGTATDGLTSGTGTLDRSDIGREEGQGTHTPMDLTEAHFYRGELTATEVALHYGRSAFLHELVDDYMLGRGYPITVEQAYDPWHDDDNTYIRSSDTDDVALFGIESIPASYDASFGIAVKAVVKKNEPGDRAIALPIRSGGTTSAGSDKGVGVGQYVYVQRLLDDDPTDSNPWSNSKLNALEIGVKTR